MKLTRFSHLAVGLLSFAALLGQAEAQSSMPAGAPASSDVVMPPLAPQAVDQPDRQELSLAFGTFFGRFDTNYLSSNFGMDEKMDLDINKVIEGFSNYLLAPDTAMQWTQVTNILNRQVAYLKGKVQQESDAMVAAGPENKAKGMKFLDDNAAAQGVTRLTNGVEVKVIKDGDGVMPAMNDLVTLNLTAKLIDGTEVGTMIHRELPVSNLRPLPVALAQVLTTMKAGSHWVVYLPYDLAYGDKPAITSALRAPKVPPYSAMIFDVALEAVRTPPTSMSAPPAGGGMGGAPNRATMVRTPSTQAMPQTSSDIVRVPSAEELKRGSNIEVMTLEQAIKNSQTNAPKTP